MSIERRFKKLEAQVNHSGVDVTGDLYDCDGNQITDARIVRLPTEKEDGLAILADRSRRTIHAKISLLDILKERRRQNETEQDRPERSEEERAAIEARYRETLWLRKDGKMGLIESLHHKKTEEE